ncbi:MAG: hypothetical protein RLZZ156_2427, partial [Deinococcota bacterium]
WYLEKNPRLELRIVGLIEAAENEVLVSIASLWEMSIKAGMGKLDLPLGMSMVQLEQHLKNLDFQILEIKTKHLDGLKPLPLHHKDPFDRMLIAQAMFEKATLVSDDEFFGLYDVELI